MRYFLCSFIALAVLFPGLPVQAEESLMDLWPNQRSGHQAGMDADAQAYQERGQAYIDHIYDKKSEEPMEAPDDIHGMNRLSIDDDTLIETTPVDVNDVATIIKEDSQSSAAQ